MKKIVHYVACLFMGLSLTGCSDDDPPIWAYQTKPNSNASNSACEKSLKK